MENTITEYSFSPENIKSIPIDKYDKDFLFKVNGKTYKASRIVADLLSPIIRQYHYEDESINEFTINTNINEGQTDIFNDFLQITNFEIKTLDSVHKKFFSEYFLQLGNIVEYSKIISSLTPENVIEILNQLTENFQYIKTSEMTNVIEFAASNFSEISKDKLGSVDICVIEEIVKNEKLRIDDEDWLLEFILDMYAKDAMYASLLEYVHFQSVSEHCLERFVNEFDIDHLNRSIWDSICLRLLRRKETDTEKCRYLQSKSCSKCFEIQYKEGSEMNGIIQYLTEKTGGNIHDNGTIAITSKTVNNGYSPRNLVDFQNSNYYYSLNQPNGYVCFDFKDRKIKLKNYSIKRQHEFQGGCNMKSWTVEGSADGSAWTKIDEHMNDPSLNGSNNVVTFNTNGNESFYRFIKFTQTGRSWGDNDYILIGAIEMYGMIDPPLTQNN